MPSYLAVSFDCGGCLKEIVPLEDGVFAKPSMQANHGFQKVGFPALFPFPAEQAELRGGILLAAKADRRHAYTYIYCLLSTSRSYRRSTAFMIEESAAVGPGSFSVPCTEAARGLPK